MRLELKIVDLLTKKVKKQLTINEIAKTLKEYYSFVHRTVNKLAKDGVIIKNKVGKAHLCSLNLGNEKTLALVQLNEIGKRDTLYSTNKGLKLVLEDFVKSVEAQRGTIAVVLFGSYAKGLATSESDIDILLITTGKANVDKLTREMYAKYGKEIAVIVMTTHDFKKQKDKPLIKDVVNDHYVLHGVENFVHIVFRK